MSAHPWRCASPVRGPLSGGVEGRGRVSSSALASLTKCQHRVAHTSDTVTAPEAGSPRSGSGVVGVWRELRSLLFLDGRPPNWIRTLTDLLYPGLPPKCSVFKYSPTWGLECQHMNVGEHGRGLACRTLPAHCCAQRGREPAGAAQDVRRASGPAPLRPSALVLPRRSPGFQQRVPCANACPPADRHRPSAPKPAAPQELPSGKAEC